MLNGTKWHMQQHARKARRLHIALKLAAQKNAAYGFLKHSQAPPLSGIEVTRLEACCCLEEGGSQVCRHDRLSPARGPE
jgi:hypothetical protein